MGREHHHCHRRRRLVSATSRVVYVVGRFHPYRAYAFSVSDTDTSPQPFVFPEYALVHVRALPWSSVVHVHAPFGCALHPAGHRQADGGIALARARVPVPAPSGDASDGGELGEGLGRAERRVCEDRLAGAT